MLALFAICVAVALALWRVFGGYPRPASPAEALAPRELATLDAVATAMFPPGGAISASGAEAGIAGYVDRLIAISDARNRLAMRALFFLVEHATLFFPAPGGLGGLRRYSALDPEQREAVLDAWSSSGLFLRRLVFTSLRALVTMGYFAHPPVLRQLGVAPYAIRSPVCEADLLYPRVGQAPESIAWTRADVGAARDPEPIPLDAPLHPAYAEGPE